MNRAAFWCYSAVDLLTRSLPMPAVVRIGRALGWIAWIFALPYRKLALRNLRIAFAGEKRESELKALARRHFITLGGNLLSNLRASHLTAGEIGNLVTVEGWELADRFVKERRPIVLVISHIGNWELLSQVAPQYLPEPMGVIYQRLGNPYIDAHVRRSRSRAGVLLFERKAGFQGALKVLRNGAACGVLIDQHAGDAGVWCPFFGRLASTTPLAAMLAMRTGAVLLPAAMHTAGTGRWRFVFSQPIEPNQCNSEELAAQINLSLETQIRSQPEDWFWVHDRWKTPNPKFLLTDYKRGVFPGAAPPKPFQILIRSSNWLGDAVMSIPAVKVIKNGRPDARVTVLCPAKLKGVWAQVPEVDEVIEIPEGAGPMKVARQLRDRFDVAVILPNSARTALEAWLAGIPRRVGYPGHNRTVFLNQVFREKRKKKRAGIIHQSSHYLKLAEFIGADIEQVKSISRSGFLTPLIRPADELASKRNGPKVLKLAVCPGAEYGPAKRWFPERFAAVMDEIAERRECEWVILGVGKDAPIAEQIVAACKAQVSNFVGKTSLEELVSILRTCDLLLTNDTGTMHLAGMLGIPVVAIFGSTEPALTGPLGSQSRIVRHHVPCSPCFLRECPLDFRCMEKVTVAEVTSAIRTLLAEASSPPTGLD